VKIDKEKLENFAISTKDIINIPSKIMIEFLFNKAIDTFYKIYKEVNNTYGMIRNYGQKSRIVHYKESNILDQIINENDLVGMFIVIHNEMGDGMLSCKHFFKQNELNKSNAYNFFISNPF
jgi:hypothetical protein